MYWGEMLYKKPLYGTHSVVGVVFVVEYNAATLITDTSYCSCYKIHVNVNEFNLTSKPFTAGVLVTADSLLKR